MSRDDGKSPKVVLVTGASSGIGASVARAAAARGHWLVLTARRADRLEALAAELLPLGVEVLCVPTAIEEPGAPERIVAETLARFGRLDVVINNAGLGLPTLFEDSEPDDLRRQLEVNFVAPLLLVRHALPHLVERRGVIINIGSMIAAVPNPALGAYGATKAGLAYFSWALRRELRHKGVQVCLVEPGPVKTEFFAAMAGLGPEPGRYHPMLDAPSPWMSSRVDNVAQRVVRLIERPRGRVSVPWQFAVPWRLIGGFFLLFPGLGDRGVSSIVQFYEGKDERTGSPSRSNKEAAPTE